MNKEIGELWVKELRGGDFEQGKGLLRKKSPDPDTKPYDSLCCLGVLCELAVEAGVIPEPQERNGEIAGYYRYGERETGVSATSLPPAVRD